MIQRHLSTYQVLYEEADILDVRINMSIFLPANAEAI